MYTETKMVGIFYQVAVADVSAVTYFAPILAFMVVFALMFALLKKSKLLGENTFIQIFISFLIATIFVIAGSVRQVVLNVIPWFAVLLLALFFILMLAGFIGKSEDFIGKKMGWLFIAALIFIFIISGVKVFSGVLWPYLPGPAFGSGASDPELLFFLSWLYSPRVVGALLLIGAAALTSWVLVRKAK